MSDHALPPNSPAVATRSRRFSGEAEASAPALHRRLLIRLARNFRSTFMNITSNGIRLHVSDNGHGNLAVVFLHCWGGSSRTWDRVLAALPPRYRTVAIDQRGWGSSEHPSSGFSVADLANDTAGAIEALGLERYILVGHSMGGKTAQFLASRRPKGL